MCSKLKYRNSGAKGSESKAEWRGESQRDPKDPSGTGASRGGKGPRLIFNITLLDYILHII